MPGLVSDSDFSLDKTIFDTVFGKSASISLFPCKSTLDFQTYYKQYMNYIQITAFFYLLKICEKCKSFKQFLSKK